MMRHVAGVMAARFEATTAQYGDQCLTDGAILAQNYSLVMQCKTTFMWYILLDTLVSPKSIKIPCGQP